MLSQLLQVLVIRFLVLLFFNKLENEFGRVYYLVYLNSLDLVSTVSSIIKRIISTNLSKYLKES